MEIATGATWFYTYDHRNRMTEARQETSAGAVIQTVTFAYDALDRRIEKALDADPVRYTYMGDMICSRTDATNGEEFFLSSGIDQWLARADASTTVWYDTDRMGTARRVVDATATILAERVYSSFGDILVDANPTLFGEIGFTGREYDETVALNFYRTRFYDPVLGSFLGEDQIGNQLLLNKQLRGTQLGGIFEAVGGKMERMNERSTHYNAFAASDFNLSRYAFNSPTTYQDPIGTSSGNDLKILRVVRAQTALGVAHLYVLGTSRLTTIAIVYLGATTYKYTASSGQAMIIVNRVINELRGVVIYFR